MVLCQDSFAECWLFGAAAISAALVHACYKQAASRHSTPADKGLTKDSMAQLPAFLRVNFGQSYFSNPARTSQPHRRLGLPLMSRRFQHTAWIRNSGSKAPDCSHTDTKGTT